MRKGTCKHFTGTQNPTCRENISYDNFRGEGQSLPCLSKFNKFGTTCDFYADPSDAEIAEGESHLRASYEKFAKALPIIKEIKKAHKGQNWKGAVKCPVCGGELVMTHASTNGHVWGCCKTEGCLSWME
jgi:hypothetical protein